MNFIWQSKVVWDLNSSVTIWDTFDNFRQFWPILTIFDNVGQSLTSFDNFVCESFDYNDKDNPSDLWHLRHWLQFWQLRTWIHDNLCYLTIKSDTGQHSQFLRCLLLTTPQQFHCIEIDVHPMKPWTLSSHFILIVKSVGYKRVHGGEYFIKF